jgi:hypothetical protein
VLGRNWTLSKKCTYPNLPPLSMKIEISNNLRGEIAAAAESLNTEPDASQFKSAVQVAQRAISFYQKTIPEVYADHVAEFYRDRRLAIEAGQHCDACASIAGWRNSAHAMETEAATPENIAWLKRIFDCVLAGQLHLRA